MNDFFLVTMDMRFEVTQIRNMDTSIPPWQTSKILPLLLADTVQIQIKLKPMESQPIHGPK